MKVYLCFVFVSSVFGELVLHKTLYTVLTGIEKQPDCIVLSFVGDLQIDYYNSSSRIVEVHELAKPLAPPNYTQQMSNVYSSECTRMKTQLTDIMERFEHRSGAHMFQRKFGCKWDHVTGFSEGLDEYRYDGQIVLAVKNGSSVYIHLLREASEFAEALNNKSLLKERDHYYKYECLQWPKRITYYKHTYGIKEKQVKPDAHLFQRDPSSPVVCFATGFYPKAVTISWQKNGEDLNEVVECGETLINDDGTFQKKCSLTVRPGKWKSDEYSCVVQHVTGEIILTQSSIKTNYDPPNIIEAGVVLLVTICGIISLIIIVMYCKENIMYIKLNPKD